MKTVAYWIAEYLLRFSNGKCHECGYHADSVFMNKKYCDACWNRQDG